MADQTVILPHVAEAIYALKRRGFALGVVSLQVPLPHRARAGTGRPARGLRRNCGERRRSLPPNRTPRDCSRPCRRWEAYRRTPATLGIVRPMPRPRSALRCRSLPCFPASPRGQHSAPTLSTPSLQALPAFLTQSRAGPYSSAKLNEA